MNENESIDDMISMFTKITNDLTSLGDKIDNNQKVRKVICALPLSWEVKPLELNDKEEVEFISLFGNLKTHEVKRKDREEKAP